MGNKWKPWIAALVFLLGALAAAGAQGRALVRIERKTAGDRTFLIRQGIPLVAELSTAFLAWGDEEELKAETDSLGYTMQVLDRDTKGWWYSILQPLGEETPESLSLCGEMVAALEDDLLLVKSREKTNPACMQSRDFLVAYAALEPLQLPVGPPPAYEHLAKGLPQPLQTVPLVQDIVDSMTGPIIMNNWADIVNSANSRASTDPGCLIAADLVYTKYQNENLSPQYQFHTPGHAPNVVGTLPGKTHPENVYIAIGHLDDMPRDPPGIAAPGADDNASGTSMVTAAAEVMSGYAFANTVKFLNVTGEEFGLYGSRYYACHAAGQGENILGVLNGDMIGWEGDGSPVPENLDVDTNAPSQWLGDLLAQLATDYGTGCVVDPFLCPTMTASDHAPFWSRGYSAICGITDNGGSCGHNGFYGFYHTSNDTLANCGDPTFHISVVKAYTATLAHLAEPLCKNPAVPASLNASPGGPNHVLVSWTPLASRVKYEIYRAPGGCATTSPYTKIGETLSSSFDDSTASGGLNYAYVVRARDKTGYCLSGPSTCVEAGTSGDCLEPPLFAGVTSVTDTHADSCGLTLRWADATQNVCGTRVTYNIYRSTDPAFTPGPASLIASCFTGTTYTDTALDPATRYTYIVRAEDDSTGHSGPCGGNEDRNEIRLSGTATGAENELFFDDFESGTQNWSATNPWTSSTAQSHSGSRSVFSGNVADACAGLKQDNPIALPAGTSSFLTFWVNYNLETCYDGVQVQISSDGTTWTAVVPEDGYAGTTSAICSLLRGNRVFTGGPTSDWTLEKIDLTSYAGSSVQVRFVQDTDGGVDSGGFYVDDVRIYAESLCGTKLVPTGTVILDTCPSGPPGDHDGVIDPGEDIVLEVTAKNLGTVAATNVVATLTSLTPGVTIINAVDGFPDIAGGTAQTSQTPQFSFHVDASLPCRTAITLPIHFASSEGEWDSTVTLTVGKVLPDGGTALQENFGAAGMPPGWTVIDGSADGKTWYIDTAADPAGCGPLDPGSPFAGGWARVDSNCAGAAAMDEQLISPMLDLTAADSVALVFDQILRLFSSEKADLDVRSSKTGGAWVTAARLSGVTAAVQHVTIDISAQAAGAGDVEIRWHYYDAADDLYWALDNVAVTYTTAASCVMNPCVELPPGEVSPRGCTFPLKIVKDAATCPAAGVCLYFEKEPVARGYNLYEGTLGSWYSHDGAPGDDCDGAVVDLSTGEMRYSLSPSAGSHYYLVTAFNGGGEGTAGNPQRDTQLSCPP
jgi:hypothetical protein